MNLDPRTLELLHAEVDGVITAGERGELQRILASNPEAGRELTRLRALSEVLASVPAVEPPAGMTAQVRSAIASADQAAAGRPSVAASRISWLDALMGTPNGGVSLFRFGYAMIGVLVLGLVIGKYGLSPRPGSGGPGSDPARMVGTMAGLDTVQRREVAATTGVKAQGVTGKLEVGPVEGGILVVSDVVTDEPTGVSIDFHDENARYLGYAHDPDGITEVRTSTRELGWTQRGKGRVAVLLPVQADRWKGAHVTFSRGAEVVLDQPIVVIGATNG